MIRLAPSRPLQSTVLRKHLIRQLIAANCQSPSQLAAFSTANSTPTLTVSRVRHRLGLDQKTTTTNLTPISSYPNHVLTFKRSLSSTSTSNMASTDSNSKEQPKITVYWLNESRSQRLIWLLEELNLPYNIKLYHRDENMLAPPALQKIHPLGKAPIVTIHLPTSDTPLVLAESGFIMQYLTSHFTSSQSSSSTSPTVKPRNLIPTHWIPGRENTLAGETESYLRYQYYLHYTEGSLQPTLLVSIILQILKSNKIPFPIRPITSFVANKFFTAFVLPHLHTDLTFLEQQLETAPNGGGYICGNHLTAADILLSFPLGLVKERIGNVDRSVLDKYPRLWAYLDRLMAEEGYKRAERRIEEVERAEKEKK